jgi:hypothetical protein
MRKTPLTTERIPKMGIAPSSALLFFENTLVFVRHTTGTKFPLTPTKQSSRADFVRHTLPLFKSCDFASLSALLRRGGTSRFRVNFYCDLP